MAENSTRESRVRMTPLVLIAAFLSLTELVAGYTILQTAGQVQFILTIFVIAFPALICVAFFYLLAFRNYTLFAPHEFQSGRDAHDFVRAMKGQPPVSMQQRQGEEPYAAHALFGILDGIRCELPDVVDDIGIKRPARVVVEAGVLNSLVRGSNRVINRSRPPEHSVRLSAGAIPRSVAEISFPFLSDRFTRRKTQSAIQALKSQENNNYYQFAPDGTVLNHLDLNSGVEAASSTKAEYEYEEVLRVQIISLVNGQLVVLYDPPLEVSQPSARSSQLVSALSKVGSKISRAALVISDEGDIFGTIDDVSRFAREYIELREAVVG